MERRISFGMLISCILLRGFDGSSVAGGLGGREGGRVGGTVLAASARARAFCLALRRLALRPTLWSCSIGNAAPLFSPDDAGVVVEEPGEEAD